MKRRSEITYTSPSTHRTDFLMHPDLTFDRSLPRLVDYSGSDVSDDSEDCRTHFDKSLDNLKTSLEALGTPVPYLDKCLRRKVLQKSISRTLRERASLRLKEEKDAEDERNNRMIKTIHLEDILNTSQVEFEGERPAKRMKMDKVFKRLSPRRISFLKKSRKRISSPIILDSDPKRSFFNFLKK